MTSHNASRALLTAVALVVMAFMVLRALAESVKPGTRASGLGQPVATSGTLTATLLLSADALVLPAGGRTALTALVRDQAGLPVPGMTVSFTGMLGSVAPASGVTAGDGTVTTTFTTGTAPGNAAIIATCNGVTQSAWLQVGYVEPAGTLGIVAATREIVTGGQTAVTITLRDDSGRPAGGQLVSVFGSLGIVTPSSAVSGEGGQATFTFSAGQWTGEATLTALAGYSASSITITIHTAQQRAVYLPYVLHE